MSVALSYSQRLKTDAQTCQPAVQIPRAMMPQKLVTAIETPTIIEVLELTQVKSIGEKRATQLKVRGINSFDDLAKASAKDITKKSQISPKITKKWIKTRKPAK